MTVTVGRFILPDAWADELAPVATEITNTLPLLRKNITVEVKPRKEMPPVLGTPIYSEGYAPSATKMLLSAKIARRPKALKEVMTHEAIHNYSAQVGRQGFRTATLACLSPAGAKWNAPGYSRDGREAIACYGSSALFGVAPRNAEFYAYTCPDLPKLAAALLADYTPTPPVVEPPPLPLPPPDEDCEDLAQQLADQQRINADLLQALSAAKTWAGQIEVKAGEIEDLARQIEAL